MPMVVQILALYPFQARIRSWFQQFLIRLLAVPIQVVLQLQQQVITRLLPISGQTLVQEHQLLTLL